MNKNYFKPPLLHHNSEKLYNNPYIYITIFSFDKFMNKSRYLIKIRYL